MEVPGTATVMRYEQSIGGQWVDSASGETLGVTPGSETPHGGVKEWGKAQDGTKEPSRTTRRSRTITINTGD
jgi:hypothetical protein